MEVISIDQERKKREVSALVTLEAEGKPFPVQAKRLHHVLDSKTYFTTWLNRRTEKGILDHDYSWIFSGENAGSEPVNDCFFSLDFAMHVALMEDTDTGRQVRVHFIAVKKEYEALKAGVIASAPMQLARIGQIRAEYEAAPILLGAHLSAAKILGTPDSLAKAIAVQAVSRALPSVDFKPLLTMNVSDIQDKLLNPTELGKPVGLSAVAVNRLLAAKLYQVKNESSWHLTELGKPFGVYLDTGKKHSNGTPIQQIKWRESVLKMIQESQ